MLNKPKMNKIYMTRKSLFEHTMGYGTKARNISLNDTLNRKEYDKFNQQGKKIY
jgi:hypothetical protein